MRESTTQRKSSPSRSSSPSCRFSRRHFSLHRHPSHLGASVLQRQHRRRRNFGNEAAVYASLVGHSIWLDWVDRDCGAPSRPELRMRRRASRTDSSMRSGDFVSTGRRVHGRRWRKRGMMQWKRKVMDAVSYLAMRASEYLARASGPAVEYSIPRSLAGRTKFMWRRQRTMARCSSNTCEFDMQME